MEWQIEDGDLVISNGDVFTVPNDIYIAQLLASLFGTRTGSLSYDQSFGFNSEFITNQIAVSNPNDILIQLRENIISMISNYIAIVNTIDVDQYIVDNTKYKLIYDQSIAIRQSYHR